MGRFFITALLLIMSACSCLALRPHYQIPTVHFGLTLGYNNVNYNNIALQGDIADPAPNDDRVTCNGIEAGIFYEYRGLYFSRQNWFLRAVLTYRSNSFDAVEELGPGEQDIDIQGRELRREFDYEGLNLNLIYNFYLSRDFPFSIGAGLNLSLPFNYKLRETIADINPDEEDGPVTGTPETIFDGDLPNATPVFAGTYFELAYDMDLSSFGSGMIWRSAIGYSYPINGLQPERKWNQSVLYIGMSLVVAAHY